MVLDQGVKLHVITRRGFESDQRRHFAGSVEAWEPSGLARLSGYSFVFEAGRNEFVKRRGLRSRILNLGDSGHIVNVLPADVKLDDLRYTTSSDRRTVLSDGHGFELDINEFGSQR